MTPIYFQLEERQDGSRIKFIETSTSTAVVNRPIAEIDFDHEDYFVIESLIDTNGNTIFIAYGFDWKGTWASGITLKLIYPDIATYTNAYYIFHWVDEDSDGIPDAPELYQVFTGN